MSNYPEEHGENEKGLSGLGSLAQSARLKQLNTARWVLIVLGILMILGNGALIAIARQQLTNEVQKKGMVIVNQEEFERSLMIFRLILAVPLVLGIVFIVLGLMVKAYPVPITILALVLYVASNLGFALLNPEGLLQGIILKVIVVVALAKAIQAALAYQSEMSERLYEPELHE